MQNYMDIIRYAVSIILGLYGLYIIVMNWCIIYNGIFKKIHSSTGPILGGLLLCISFIIIPNNPYIRFWWLAFIIDISSLPYLIYIGITALMGKYRGLF